MDWLRILRPPTSKKVNAMMANKAMPDSRPQDVSSNFFTVLPQKSIKKCGSHTRRGRIFASKTNGNILLLLLGNLSAELGQHFVSIFQALGFRVFHPFSF